MAESALNRGEKSFRVVRLLKESSRAFLSGNLFEICLFARRDVNDGNIIQPEVFETFFAEESDRIRHPDVGNDQVRSIGGGGEKALASIGCVQDVVACMRKAESEGSGDAGIVFDEEYFFAVSHSRGRFLAFSLHRGVGDHIGLSLESVSDRRKELVWIVGLLKKSDGTQLLGGSFEAGEPAGSNENERNVLKAELWQALSDGETNTDGHPDVHENEGGPVGYRPFNAFKAVRRNDRFVTGGFEANSECCGNFPIIFNY
jgi:hypothetical protein